MTLLSTGLPVDLFPYMALEQKAAAEWKIVGLTSGPLFMHCSKRKPESQERKRRKLESLMVIYVVGKGHMSRISVPRKKKNIYATKHNFSNENCNS